MELKFNNDNFKNIKKKKIQTYSWSIFPIYFLRQMKRKQLSFVKLFANLILDLFCRLVFNFSVLENGIEASFNHILLINTFYCDTLILNNLDMKKCFKILNHNRFKKHHHFAKHTLNKILIKMASITED